MQVERIVTPAKYTVELTEQEIVALNYLFQNTGWFQHFIELDLSNPDSELAHVEETLQAMKKTLKEKVKELVFFWE